MHNFDVGLADTVFRNSESWLQLILTFVNLSKLGTTNFYAD
jgi:hypothetical protein